MAKLKEMDVPIEGMHCASCVLSVNKTFEREEGVEAVDADLASNKLHITVNPKKMTYDEIKAYNANVLSDKTATKVVDVLNAYNEAVREKYRFFSFR